MSSFTACVITGSVMMNMISSTNMTSINGVVLISIIGSPSPPPPTLIAMASYLRTWSVLAVSGRRAGFGDEPDLLDAGALRIENDATDVLVARLSGRHARALPAAA